MLSLPTSARLTGNRSYSLLNSVIEAEITIDVGDGSIDIDAFAVPLIHRGYQGEQDPDNRNGQNHFYKREAGLRRASSRSRSGCERPLPPEATGKLLRRAQPEGSDP